MSLVKSITCNYKLCYLSYNMKELKPTPRCKFVLYNDLLYHPAMDLPVYSEEYPKYPL